MEGKYERGVRGQILFSPDIILGDQVGIRNDLRNRRDRTSVVEQFAFGLWNEFFLPSGATGTCVYVTKSWHQASAPHFTAWLVFLFDTPRRAQHWATAHVYLDFSESVCKVIDGPRRCWVKKLWEEDYTVYDLWQGDKGETGTHTSAADAAGRRIPSPLSFSIQVHMSRVDSRDFKSPTSTLSRRCNYNSLDGSFADQAIV
ncbi:hypothetical protein AA0116_g9951 [Alternaria tenuissima]|nr:hypothetical protein AA0116_g9951 [Alternaria tenuissima]